jgi:hypothetical protein
MIRVNEYTETIDYIKDSYNYQIGEPRQEFLDVEDVTVKISVSGLTRGKASELKAALDGLGISK